MYQILLSIHSATRWLLLAALIFSIYRAWRGLSDAAFTKTDNALRHWTATIAHIQLVIGIILYTQSPVVKYFWKHKNEAGSANELWFFGLLHILLMLAAIVMVTIGSSLAKRREGGRVKHRTILLWYSLALLLIIIAIPWPFSPLTQRPYYR